MAKIELRRFAKPRRAETKPKTVKTKVLSANNGKVTVRAIDANSATFGSDFLYVFTQNVRAAREENRTQRVETDANAAVQRSRVAEKAKVSS